MSDSVALNELALACAYHRARADRAEVELNRLRFENDDLKRQVSRLSQRVAEEHEMCRKFEEKSLRLTEGKQRKARSR